jgi:hypothetical protein
MVCGGRRSPGPELVWRGPIRVGRAREKSAGAD